MVVTTGTASLAGACPVREVPGSSTRNLLSLCSSIQNLLSSFMVQHGSFLPAQHQPQLTHGAMAETWVPLKPPRGLLEESIPYPKSHIPHPICYIPSPIFAIPLPTLCMLYVTSHIQCPITCPISSIQPPTSCVPHSISCILYPISCLPPPPNPTPCPPPTEAAPPPCPFPINTLSPAMWGNFFYYFQGPELIMP